MKKIICDNCGSENARSYQYKNNRTTSYTDLCVNCIQDWVLKHQTKLTEVIDSTPSPVRRIIHG